MANWRVGDKKPCPLNKIGQVKKWLSYQLILRDIKYTDCILSRTRVKTCFETKFKLERKNNFNVSKSFWSVYLYIWTSRRKKQDCCPYLWALGNVRAKKRSVDSDTSLLSLLSDSNQRPQDYKSCALTSWAKEAGWVSYLHRAATTNYLCYVPVLEGFEGSWPCKTYPFLLCKGNTFLLKTKQ